MTSDKPVQDKSAPSVESYNEVVERAQLASVQLISTNFDVKPEFFGDGEDRKLSYFIHDEGVEVAPEQGVALGFLMLEVDARLGRKKVLTCKSKYVVTYSGLAGCDEDAIRAFLTRVAPFTCYPYFRSLFASLDWAAVTNLPPLPIHKENIPKKNKKSKK